MSWDQLREMGSSPRIRGKPGHFPIGAEGVGLIPAHTGKTNSGITIGNVYGAHPRAYGENLDEAAVPIEFGGSSPRIRGKR